MTERIEMSSIIKKRTLGLVFAAGASLTFAQQKVPVSGTITGAQNQAIPYASVTFTNKANKLYNDAALSDDKGSYTLELMPGNYDITVEAIDFKKYTVNRNITAGGSIGSIRLEAEGTATTGKTQEIQGVTITAQSAKPYRVEIDKKVYDPSQDVISKGGNLQDVLSNVPSVAVDTDGTVSMRGNSNIRFLINGKPSSLLGIDDGADALKSIPADQIERIEVITNPSSKFEASGTAGILNIILKKNKKVGFNGSVEGSVGYLPNTRLNANLNWRRGPWTYYINGGGGYSRNKNHSYSLYNTRLTDSQLLDNDLVYSRQDGFSKGENKNYNVNTGFVVDLSEKSSLNASVMLRRMDNTSTDTTNYLERLADKNTATVGYPNVPYTISEQTSSRVNEGTRYNNSFQADLGLDQKIGDKGQLLSLATSFQQSKGTNNSIANDQGLAGGGLTTLVNNILSDTDNKTFLAKGDYELPIGENSKFEAGARFDLNDNQYNYFVDESRNGSPFQTLSRFTSNTAYTEKISAAYAQFKSKVGAFGYQAGLRAENSNIDVNFKRITDAAQTSVSKNYTGFFPSVFLSYDVTSKNQLLLNYSRRIQRPRSFFLIPFMSYNNNRNLFLGNPDLNPTYENSFELGYSLSVKKLILNPTLYYKKSQDEVNIYQYRDKDEAGNTVIYTMPVNAGSENNYGLDLNFTYDPFKWWRLMGNVDLFGYKNEGSYKDFSFEGDGFSTRLRLTSTFKPDKNTSMQVQGFYRGAEKTVSSERDPMYAINFGASRTIWKGDGTLAFNVQDIFNTRRMKRTAITNTYTQYSEMQWQPRQFNISLTYRFRQGDKIEQPKKKRDTNTRNTGSEDEQMPL